MDEEYKGPNIPERPFGNYNVTVSVLSGDVFFDVDWEDLRSESKKAFQVKAAKWTLFWQARLAR